MSGFGILLHLRLPESSQVRELHILSVMYKQ